MRFKGEIMNTKYTLRKRDQIVYSFETYEEAEALMCEMQDEDKEEGVHSTYSIVESFDDYADQVFDRWRNGQL